MCKNCPSGWSSWTLAVITPRLCSYYAKCHAQMKQSTWYLHAWTIAGWNITNTIVVKRQHTGFTTYMLFNHYKTLIHTQNEAYFSNVCLESYKWQCFKSSRLVHLKNVDCGTPIYTWWQLISITLITIWLNWKYQNSEPVYFSFSFIYWLIDWLIVLLTVGLS